MGLSDRSSELEGVLAAWAVCPPSMVSGTKVVAVAAVAAIAIRIRRRWRLRVGISREKVMDRPRSGLEGASTTLSLVIGVVVSRG